MSGHRISSKMDDEVEHQVEGKIDGAKVQDTEDLIMEENDKAYPPLRVVLPAMAAIYLAVFLVALVRQIWNKRFTTMTDHPPGSHHHWHSRTHDIQRVPQLRGYCMVRGRLSLAALHAPIVLRPSVQILLGQMGARCSCGRL